MGKSYKRQVDRDNDDENVDFHHSDHLTEKRIISALKSKNVDKLLELDADNDEDSLLNDDYNNEFEFEEYDEDWEEYKRKNGL